MPDGGTFLPGTRFACISAPVIQSWHGMSVSATDLAVFACIASFADRSGRAWPGMARIAEMVGIRCKDVPRHIRRLEQRGLLRVTPGGGRRRTNLYTVARDAPEENIRNGATEKHPQPCVRNIRNRASETSAALRDKQTREQTKGTHQPSGLVAEAGSLRSPDVCGVDLRSDEGEEAAPQPQEPRRHDDRQPELALEAAPEVRSTAASSPPPAPGEPVEAISQPGGTAAPAPAASPPPAPPDDADEVEPPPRPALAGLDKLRALWPRKDGLHAPQLKRLYHGAVGDVGDEAKLLVRAEAFVEKQRKRFGDAWDPERFAKLSNWLHENGHLDPTTASSSKDDGYGFDPATWDGGGGYAAPEWDDVLALWRDPAKGGPTRERWCEAHGPAPGVRGCRVPPQELAKHPDLPRFSDDFEDRFLKLRRIARDMATDERGRHGQRVEEEMAGWLDQAEPGIGIYSRADNAAELAAAAGMEPWYPPTPEEIDAADRRAEEARAILAAAAAAPYAARRAARSTPPPQWLREETEQDLADLEQRKAAFLAQLAATLPDVAVAAQPGG